MDHVWDNSVDSFSNSICTTSPPIKPTVLAMTPSGNRIGEGHLMEARRHEARLSQWRITLMSVLLIGITCA